MAIPQHVRAAWWLRMSSSQDGKGDQSTRQWGSKITANEIASWVASKNNKWMRSLARRFWRSRPAAAGRIVGLLPNWKRPSPETLPLLLSMPAAIPHLVFKASDRIWLYSPAAPSLGWAESRQLERLGRKGPGRRRSLRETPGEGTSRVRDHQGVLAPGLNQLP